jgi:hypothetical protein
MITRKRWITMASVATSLLAPASSQALAIRVTIENLAPANGTFQTPFWVGFHNGSFDLYDPGVPASVDIERIAEDGNTAPVMASFGAALPGAAQATIPGPGGPFAPGASSSMDFTLDPLNPLSRYFSYASMVIPSNDAFVANGNPLAFQIFDAAGMFLGADFIVLGSQILDAGTEANDEVPANTAFFGQMTPNTGVDENGVIHSHPGLLPAGSGGILDDPMFANADFTAQGYQAVRIRITAVPDTASTLGLLGLSCGVFFMLAKARKLRPVLIK